MKVKCGSCSSEYEDVLAECDNCGFPNRRFLTPLKGVLAIEVEADLISSMEAFCKRSGIRLQDAYTEAIENYLSAQHRKGKRA